MGYGHLRAAHNVAQYRGMPIMRIDESPFASLPERILWRTAQLLYHSISRTVDSGNGILLRGMERLVNIPEDSAAASLKPSWWVRFLASLGAGKRFLSFPELHASPLLHTFYSPAIFSLYHRYPGKNYLLLCDSDIHRVWVPLNPAEPNIEYFVPVTMTADRLMRYGVSSRKIFVTGFPLPVLNTGERDLGVLKADFQARLLRLSPQNEGPITIMFALSGSAAYFKSLRSFIVDILPALRERRLRLFVALNNHRALKRIVEGWIRGSNVEDEGSLSFLYHTDIWQAFSMCNAALKETDLLITKPGETIFYAGLGIPLVLLPPIGKHEESNREYLLDNHAAIDFDRTEPLDTRMERKRKEGVLAELATSAMENLPKQGTFLIHDLISERAST
jgi:hypothetical protein